MPTLLLPKRNFGLSEHMDDPSCDARRLENTYRHFALVNRAIAGWRGVYKRLILPQRPARLLDIGCGGGDLARQLAIWAKRDGLELSITAIDPDPRALSFARARPAPPTIKFIEAHASDLNETFDVVISNHVLHHLTAEEVAALCATSARLATNLAVHNDIRRSDLAYLGFSLTAPFFRNSFITYDGLRSIRRSFTRAELAALAPAGWRVERAFPYRNLLVYRP